MKRDNIKKHLLKIMALFLAFFLWLYVLNSDPIIFYKKQTVNFILPNQTMLTNVSTKEVTLKIKGPNAFIQNAFNKNDKIKIDLTPFKENLGEKLQIKILNSDVIVPMGVELLDVSPRVVEIELDQIVKKKISVRASYIGSFPLDRRIKKISIIPEEVLVEGPKSVLDQLKKIDTGPISFSELDKNEVHLEVPLTLQDLRLKLVDINRVKIDFVTISISAKK